MSRIDLKSQTTRTTTSDDDQMQLDVGDAQDESDDIDGEKVVLSKLVDIKQKPKKVGRGTAGGRPKNDLLDKLLHKCYRSDKPEKHLFRCSGTCGTTFTNRNLDRAIKHARTCSKLPSELRQIAKERAAKDAPSEIFFRSRDIQLKIEIGDQSSNDADDTKKVVKKKKDSDDTENIVVVKKRKVTTDTLDALVEEARSLSRKDRHHLLDLAIVRFFCVTGTPTSIAAKKVWRDVLTIADHTYHPATRTKLEENQIITEAENVLAKQRTLLRNEENLTASCDGGTSSGHEAYWSVHISTPARKVYFMELREATSVSHTGEWIKELMLEVVGCDYQSLFVTDLTLGNGFDWTRPIQCSCQR